MTLCMYPKHALMYSSNHFNIQPHQYTMPYLMLLKNLQLCHVLNPNSKSMLLIASILLLPRYSVQYTGYYFNDYLAPGGGCEVLFSPGLSVCLSLCVCVCVSVCVSVCPANILVFYFSAIRRDIDLKFIQDTYRVVLNSLNKLTFIGQMSRSQGRYLAF